MRVPSHRRLLLRVLAASALLGAAHGLHTSLLGQVAAPSRPAARSLVLQAGQWYLDVDGVVAAVRAELPLDSGGRWLLVPAVSYAHYTLRSPSPTIDLFAPEALVHLQLGQGRIRPYVGAGAGVVLINMFHTVDPVLSLGTGLRADLTPSLGARFELDTRGFGKLRAGSVGWSLGLAQRF
jgi:hypothetical protein